MLPKSLIAMNVGAKPRAGRRARYQSEEQRGHREDEAAEAATQVRELRETVVATSVVRSR